MTTTYWNHNGKYTKLYDEVSKLIPDSGAVANVRKNKALEKLRKASNYYYDLFNNGLINHAAGFRKVFGFSGVSIVRGKYDMDDPKMIELERKMDEFILLAAEEQDVHL